MFDGLEPLRFTPGETEQAIDGTFLAEIHVTGKELWLARIQIYGNTPLEAEALRDRLIDAYNQPHKPEFWQARHPRWEELHHEEDGWFTAKDDEIANLHGQGYEIRGCYLRTKT